MKLTSELIPKLSRRRRRQWSKSKGRLVGADHRQGRINGKSLAFTLYFQMMADEAPIKIEVAHLPGPLLDTIVGYVDLHSLCRLSWTCRFWRNRLIANNDLWRRMLVDQLYDIDAEACDRLCQLSGLDPRSLAFAVVSASQQRDTIRRYSYAEVLETVDPRYSGIITFIPQRLDLHNHDEQLQQACVDVIRWCVALSKILGSGAQFLWKGRGGRTDLLITLDYPDYISGLLSVHTGGESVYTFQDRDAYLDDMVESLNADCWFLVLDSDAPSQLEWMNGNNLQDLQERSWNRVRDRITRADFEAIVRADSGVTLGMLYGGSDFGTDFHYRAAIAGSRARIVNPRARYALTLQHGEILNLYAILNQLFFVAKTSPTVLGYPIDTLARPPASEWAGWPFGLPVEPHLR